MRENLEVEKIVSPVKRCPKCYNLSLEFDAQTNQIRCTKCGFVQGLPLINRLKNIFMRK